MANTFDRWSSGPGQQAGQGGQQNYGNWNDMVGAHPPERFGQAATDAFRQVDPQEYYNHTQPGVGGTDPFGSLPHPQRGGLAGAIQSALGGNNPFARHDPNQMSPGDMASMSQWGQRNNPEAMGRVAQQYQQQPDILSNLLGNKALDLALIGIGAKILNDRAKSR